MFREQGHCRIRCWYALTWETLEPTSPSPYLPECWWKTNAIVMTNALRSDQEPESELKSQMESCRHWQASQGLPSNRTTSRFLVAKTVYIEPSPGVSGKFRHCCSQRNGYFITWSRRCRNACTSHAILSKRELSIEYDASKQETALWPKFHWNGRKLSHGKANGGLSSAKNWFKETALEQNLTFCVMSGPTETAGKHSLSKRSTPWVDSSTQTISHTPHTNHTLPSPSPHQRKGPTKYRFKTRGSYSIASIEQNDPKFSLPLDMHVEKGESIVCGACSWKSCSSLGAYLQTSASAWKKSNKHTRRNLFNCVPTFLQEHTVDNRSTNYLACLSRNYLNPNVRSCSQCVLLKDLKWNEFAFSHAVSLSVFFTPSLVLFLL